MNNNEINFRTPRTVAGTVMEIIVGILVLAMWVLIVYFSRGAEADTVKLLVFHGLFCTVLPSLMMVACYFPKSFNIPKRHPRAEHYILSIQLVRLCCIVMMPVLIAETWGMGKPDDMGTVEWVQLVLGCIMILVFIYYIVRILLIK